MSKQATKVYKFGPFHLDSAERMLLRDGVPVALAPKVFDTLLALIEKSGHLIEKDELMRSLWPDTFVEEATLARNISDLRKALGEISNEARYIATVPKRGYRFTADVTAVVDEGVELVVERHTRSRIIAEEEKELVAPGEPLLRGAIWRGRRKLTLGIAAVLLLLTVLLSYALLQKAPAAPQPEIKSVAVLPLENLSGDPAQDYFVDGMTEELIANLSKIGVLHVISRTSVIQYKGTRRPLPEIARELNVDAVVEGSALRSGDRVRITVKLIHAATNKTMWAESYQRDLRDILALQSDVGRAIANSIRIKLTPQQEGLLASTRPVNPAALEAYLKGRDYFNQGRNKISTPEGREGVELLKSSFGFFEEAIKIDPNYALAHAGLARANHWLASSYRLPEFYPRAKESALTALQIDETLAEAHGALAFIKQFFDLDWSGAEEEYKRAIDLNPSDSEAHHGYALCLSFWGRHAEAIREINLAEQLDPLTIPLKVNVAAVYCYAREYDRSIEQFSRLLNANPNNNNVHMNMGLVYMYKGMFNEGIAKLHKAAGSNASSNARLAWAYALSGDRSKAIKILNQCLKRQAEGGSVSKGNIAVVYAALGDKDQAFAWLEKSYEERRDRLFALKVDPSLDALRSDPRFSAFVQKLGLPQ